MLLSACGTGRLIRGGQVNQNLLSALEARLTAIRGLQFLRPVTVRAVTPAEIAAILEGIDLSHARRLPRYSLPTPQSA